MISVGSGVSIEKNRSKQREYISLSSRVLAKTNDKESFRSCRLNKPTWLRVSIASMVSAAEILMLEARSALMKL